MFAKLTTKIALRKAGIPSNALAVPDFSGQPNGSKDGNANAAASMRSRQGPVF